MIKYKIKQRTTLKVNNSVEGEEIEQKIRRIVENKGPIEDGAPIIYTERKDGVIPAYNIRTDKWDITLTAMDHGKSAQEAVEYAMKRDVFTGGAVS